MIGEIIEAIYAAVLVNEGRFILVAAAAAEKATATVDAEAAAVAAAAES